MAMQRIPMMWFFKMANSIICKGGELLEYRHFIANPKIQDMMDPLLWQ
jgi:hypothetical protein